MPTKMITYYDLGQKGFANALAGKKIKQVKEIDNGCEIILSDNSVINYFHIEKDAGVYWQSEPTPSRVR